eukprot:6812236-Ditylum_brightwellii.AAC.1
MTPKEKNTLRIYFQNINGISTVEDLHGYMDEMRDREIDIWGWVETNVNWTKNLLTQAKFYGNKIFKNFTLVGNSSDDPAEFYQQ